MQKIKSNSIYLGAFTGIFLLLQMSTAAATPLLSIDLDPSTIGIQSTLSVTTGSSFTVDLVYTGDSAAMFDEFHFATVFNDASGVLGLSGGSGLVTAGSIAATAPVFAYDFFGPPAPILPGVSLTGVPAPLIPPLPFTGQSLWYGMGSFPAAGGLPFGGVPIPPGAPIDLFSMTFDAIIAGTSTVDFSKVAPFDGLFLGGGLVPTTAIFSGIVTVTDPIDPIDPIPEPTTMALFGLGLLSLAGISRRKQ